LNNLHLYEFYNFLKKLQLNNKNCNFNEMGPNLVVKLVNLVVFFTLVSLGTCQDSKTNWVQQEGMVIIQDIIYGAHQTLNFKSHICFKYNVSNVEYIKCCNGYFSRIKHKNVTIYVNENDPYDAYIDMKYRYILGPILSFVVIGMIYYFNTFSRLPRFRFRSPIEFY
jgi:hypothetical protein